MSSHAFMLPALPQTPVPGLKGPAAFKSNRLGESTDQSRSFSATLNRISERNDRRNPKATPAENRAVTSRGEDTDSVNPEKMSKTSAPPRDDIEESGAPVSGETSPSIHPLQAFGWMHDHLIPFSMADEGSLAIEPPSDSTTGSSLFMLTEWIGHLQAQGQQDQSERVGIGPFEQLQANISPEATNLAFFEQLVASAIHNRDSEGMMSNPAQFFRFWHWMATLPGQEGALNGQAESLGANVNAPLNPLLHILGMTGAAWGLNPDTSSSGGPKMAAGLEGNHLNEDLLLKMTTSSQPAETGLSENAKMAVAGHDGRLSLRASSDSNSETLLEAQARQMSENSQALKIQTALKAAAEQPAHPNSAVEAITSKTPEEAFGIKSAVLKSEILPLDVPGNKIIQIGEFQCTIEFTNHGSLGMKHALEFRLICIDHCPIVLPRHSNDVIGLIGSVVQSCPSPSGSVFGVLSIIAPHFPDNA